MRKRLLGLAAVPVILGCLALSTPATADQHSPAPFGEWNSVVFMDADTGEILNYENSPAVDNSTTAAHPYLEHFGWY
ncbi:hypothetical protein [Glutamicibacter arilaitensis]|uniref:hypothetical protein n=1 Tax=Glutamicibacter arilaitensis TaxID=256701 RepID=UPI003A90868C